MASMPAARARERPCGFRPIGDHDRDRRVEFRAGRRVDDRLEVAAAPGHENGEPAVHDRQIAVSVHRPICRGIAPSPMPVRRLPFGGPSRLHPRGVATPAASAAAADHDQADAHVERPEHLGDPDVAARPQQREDRRYVPCGRINRRVAAIGKNARQVVGNPAAGDMRHPLDQPRVEEREPSAAGRSDGGRATPRRWLFPIRERSRPA